MKKLPDYDYLHELFEYRDGDLYWKVEKARCIKIGDKAGNTTGSTRYLSITIDNIWYAGHRLIWKMHHGADPCGEIDHINGVRLDNRIDNLRVVKKQDNTRNAKRRSDNTSGVTGVSWHRRQKQWVAGIMNKHLKSFDNYKDAVACRKQAEIDEGFHKNHGRRI